MKKIYFIDRYDYIKQNNIKEKSGYEQLVKYSDCYIRIKGNSILDKVLFKLFNIKVPKDYLKYNLSKELIGFFLALITGRPVFYLYADKDAFLLPLLKHKIKSKRIRIFGTLHWPVESSQMYSFYSNNLKEQFNGIITLSQSLQSIKFENSCIIHHGINLNYWKNNYEISFENCFLIIGESNRNHIAQIEIIQEIKKNDPTAKFVVLIRDKKAYLQYENISNLYIEKKSITDNQLKELYSKVKAVILMQHYCLASNVVLEAIAMKVPLITNRVGDIEEYLGIDYPLYVSHNYTNENLKKMINSETFLREVKDYLEAIQYKFSWERILKETTEFIEKK